MQRYKVLVSFIQKYLNGTVNLVPRWFILAVVNGYENLQFQWLLYVPPCLRLKNAVFFPTENIDVLV